MGKKTGNNDMLIALPKLLPITVQMYCEQEKISKSKFYNIYNRVTKKSVSQLEHIEKILNLNAKNLKNKIKTEQSVNSAIERINETLSNN